MGKPNINFPKLIHKFIGLLKIIKMYLCTLIIKVIGKNKGPEIAAMTEKKRNSPNVKIHEK